ncbi:MAG: hypothetical protein U1F43_00530 [Myxococcota bacterium]
MIGAAELIARPAWEPAEVLALPGRCKGSLMRDWAAHLARRWGADAVLRAREDAGVAPSDVPDAPVKDLWYRVAHQLALTRAIANRFLDGDLAALEALLREDALRVKERLVDRVLRATLSPRRVLAAAPKIHAAAYDLGRMTVEVERHGATLRFEGARYFAEPTWGALQLFALRGLFLALHEPAPTIVGEPGQDSLVVRLAY